MGIAAAETAIRERLNTNWNTTAIVWPNQAYEEQETAFIYFEVMWGEAFQASLGSTTSRRFRHPGVIMIHIYVPANTGQGVAQGYADTIAAIFRGVEFSDVLCFAATIGYARKADDGGKWYGMTVTVPIEYDEYF